MYAFVIVAPLSMHVLSHLNWYGGQSANFINCAVKMVENIRSREKYITGFPDCQEQFIAVVVRGFEVFG